LGLSELAAVCNSAKVGEDEDAMVEYNGRLTTALRWTIEKTLLKISKDDKRTAPSHLHKYITWMERVNEQTRTLAVNSNDLEQTSDVALTNLADVKPEWALYSVVARNLIELIQGEVDPLQLLFSTGLAETFYANIFRSMCDDRFHVFMDLASHENPNLAILEVGAGTGGFTSHVLAALEDLELKNGGTRFSRYMYTDISHAFFENAATKFQKYENRMEFKPLDLERDILQQGFEESAYDMVIAGSVLHTTESLSSTLQNVRKALKPGGKLLFFEITGPNALALQLGFGILPGWWRGKESWRVGSQDQVTTELQWDSLLHHNGFSGNELVLRDYSSDACHSWSIIVSSAIAPPRNQVPQSRIIICHNESSREQGDLVHIIRNTLSNWAAYNFEVSCFGNLSSLTINPGDTLVFLNEIGQPLIGSLTLEDFRTLQATIQKARKVLWVTSAEEVDATFPFLGVGTGFLRTMRTEMSNSQIIQLSLEERNIQKDICAQHILSVFQNSFHLSSPEVEYIVRDGRLMVGRLIQEKIINEEMLAAVYPSIRPQPWGD
jgi:SAM-dependent methyltransferase